MSSVACLHQISPYLLERFKAYPALVDLYLNAYSLKSRMRSGVEQWSAIQELQDELADICQGSCEFRLHIQDFEHIKADIPLIFAESRFSNFQLGTRSAVGGGWESLHIFLAGTHQLNPSFVIRRDENLNNFLLVNLIGGGQSIGNNLGYGKPSYFEPNIVEELNKALREIDKDDFQKRWHFIYEANNFSASEITDEDIKEFVQFYRELKKYFKGVVKEGDALLFSVG
ncbi:MAG: YfbM family protein [Myxacorys chilensis ATA2-1-KO14]|jgi:hypothetical protein|nr:YfbM family protein [Myxacorys chilensis ATA2-1-KO14]